MKERVEIFKADDGLYWWHRVVLDVKREIVSDSAEGYVRKIDAVRQAKRLNVGVDIYDLETSQGHADAVS